MPLPRDGPVHPRRTAYERRTRLTCGFDPSVHRLTSSEVQEADEIAEQLR
jgi:hypothetical protein